MTATPETTPTARGHNRSETPAKRRWRTPLDLFAEQDARYGFGLDAAAEEGAALVLAHITPGMDTLRTPWRPQCLPNAEGQHVAWYNPPWGPRTALFPGTGAFTRRAIEQGRTLDGVVLLLPTAPDTTWWRELFAVASDVKLLPRVAFIDPDSGNPAKAPPGGGCTLFTLWTGYRGERRVMLADKLGRVR